MKTFRKLVQPAMLKDKYLRSSGYEFFCKGWHLIAANGGNALKNYRRQYQKVFANIEDAEVFFKQNS